jgi:hypothetical protein
MRFHIESIQWQLSAFRLTFGDSVVEAKRPAFCRSLFSAFSELNWTWTDGTEYSLLTRITNLGANPSRKIACSGKTLCEGNLHIPFIGQSRLEWTLGSDTLLMIPGCCQGKLVRPANQKRFAVWHQRITWGSWPQADGVWRPNLAPSLHPLIFGMILDAIMTNNDA